MTAFLTHGAAFIAGVLTGAGVSYVIFSILYAAGSDQQ